MSERKFWVRKFWVRKRLTNGIVAVFIGLLVAVSCTAPPDATLPGPPTATETPVPTRTQSSIDSPTAPPADSLAPMDAPPADSLTPTDAPSVSDTVASDIRDFTLETVTIPTSTTVTWTNRDGGSHTVTSGVPQGPDGVWDSEVLAGGDRFSFTFDEPGVYPYFCRIHSSMKATVTVTG
jgi:plastocyanin